MKQIVLVLLCTLILAGCSNTQGTPEDMGTWAIGVSMPSFYPVKVTRAYGVNEAQDWTALVHNFSQFMSDSELEYVSKGFVDYDGFSLPIGHRGITYQEQIGRGTKELPDSITLHWVSLYNSRFFITQYDVPPEVKALAKIKRAHTNNPNYYCYQPDFVFGLVPDGRAKVWLAGCGRYTYLTTLDPELETDRDANGFGKFTYENAPKRIKKRAEDAGATITPIPWDKVDQIATRKQPKKRKLKYNP